jgi:CheY-like chemotaxis protein/anti-sigma regulatory factor (Ser/Thr protein kinase)
MACFNHELRTPLHGILGNIDCMKLALDAPGFDKARQQQYVSRAEIATRSLRHLVNGVLDYASLAAGTFTVQASPIEDFAKLARDCLLLVEHSAAEKGLQLVGNSAVDISISGDSGRIGQIINNLLVRSCALLLSPSTLVHAVPLPSQACRDATSLNVMCVLLIARCGALCARVVCTRAQTNAIKFTLHGSITLHASALQADATQEAVLQVTVSDTGIGMPQADQDRIFHEHVKLEDPMHLNVGGCGLGLAISRRLAEGMGGSLTVESTAGAGSRFVLQLPVQKLSGRRGSTGPAVRASSRSGSGSGSGSALAPSSDDDESRPIRVLLAEDNVMNAEVIQSYMELWADSQVEFSLEGDWAKDGEEIVDLYCKRREKGACDVVLMDCLMPRTDGYRATQRIRDWEAANGQSPVRIIALSADTDKENEARCRTAGMSSFLPKPLTSDQLRHAVTCREAVAVAGPAGSRGGAGAVAGAEEGKEGGEALPTPTSVSMLLRKLPSVLASALAPADDVMPAVQVRPAAVSMAARSCSQAATASVARKQGSKRRASADAELQQLPLQTGNGHGRKKLRQLPKQVSPAVVSAAEAERLVRRRVPRRGQE